MWHRQRTTHPNHRLFLSGSLLKLKSAGMIRGRRRSRAISDAKMLKTCQSSPPPPPRQRHTYVRAACRLLLSPPPLPPTLSFPFLSLTCQAFSRRLTRGYTKCQSHPEVKRQRVGDRPVAGSETNHTPMNTEYTLILPPQPHAKRHTAPPGYHTIHTTNSTARASSKTQLHSQVNNLANRPFWHMSDSENKMTNHNNHDKK